jgi:hypothetical protein
LLILLPLLLLSPMLPTFTRKVGWGGSTSRLRGSLVGGWRFGMRMAGEYGDGAHDGGRDDFKRFAV